VQNTAQGQRKTRYTALTGYVPTKKSDHDNLRYTETSYTCEYHFHIPHAFE